MQQSAHEQVQEHTASVAKRYSRRVIVRAVCEVMELHTVQLKYASLLARYTHSRFLAMLLMRRGGYSLHQIGTALSRDHTTVLSGLRRIEGKLLVDDEPLQRALDEILDLLSCSGERLLRTPQRPINWLTVADEKLPLPQRFYDPLYEPRPWPVQRSEPLSRQVMLSPPTSKAIVAQARRLRALGWTCAGIARLLELSEHNVRFLIGEPQ